MNKLIRFALTLSSIVMSFLFCTAPVSGAERFVSLAGSHLPPFENWASAATNIQDAIDAAADGDTIWVTNGVYATGGKVMSGDLLNRVALDKPVTVRSVNGPWVTAIVGAGPTNGLAAIRCAWLTNHAVLNGFTIQAGATRVIGDVLIDRSGGGVWCASSNSMVINSVIRSNTASAYGGAVYRGTLQGCAVVENKGIQFILRENVVLSSTVVSNYGIAVGAGRITNSIVYYNSGSYSGDSVFAYSCTTPLPPGAGNIGAPPELLSDTFQLLSTSPCRGAGLGPVAGTDLFGVPWHNPPSIGCAEWNDLPWLAAPRFQISTDPPGLKVVVQTINGAQPMSFRWLKNGEPLPDDFRFSGRDTSTLTIQRVDEADLVPYQLVASNAWGVVTSVVATVGIRFVNVASLNPASPFTNWSSAATRIQDAIDAALPGEVVLVTNGIYAAGGKAMSGDLTNRVAIYKPLFVLGVSGPAATIIQGMPTDVVLTNGPAAVRCAWLTNSAVLSGFTLTRGATRQPLVSFDQLSGGGVWGMSSNATVFNCIITTNMAYDLGGGAYRVSLVNSKLLFNRAVGSGRPGTGLQGAGGGAADAWLQNCLISENSADQWYGGGTLNSHLQNCAVTRNSSYMVGGGVHGGSLVNCTVSDNISSGYTHGSAVSSATVSNSIIWGNLSRTSHANTNYSNSTLVYTCSAPLPPGPGNFSVDPQVLSDGVHLASTSPCLGVGDPSVVSGTDIDGQPWAANPPVGCDEWSPEPIIVSTPTLRLLHKTPTGLSVQSGSVAGLEPILRWIKDGAEVMENSGFSGSDTTNLVINGFGPEHAGRYALTASNSFGMVTSDWARVTVHCADVSSTSPVAPFTNWNSAAPTIQEAVDVAEAGSFVLVTNGIYSVGGKIMAGDLLNRVAIDKPITVASINGSAETVIQGAWDPVSTNGPLAVRGVWMSTGSILAGFTVRGGATRSEGDAYELQSGGGIHCRADPYPIVVECQILSNAAAKYGGGAAFGEIYNSTLRDNRAESGGGVAYSGGNNTLIHRNFASSSGGGVYSAWRMIHCTVVGNIAAVSGAGVFDISISMGIIRVRNSIIYGNFREPAKVQDDVFGVTFATGNSCVGFPPVSGSGNISAHPQFTDDFHLAVTSPCRGTADPLYSSGTDLDGEAWKSAPSMGCDEVYEEAIRGPMSVNFSNFMNLPGYVAGKPFSILGYVDGRAARTTWDFGDGSGTSDSLLTPSHIWTNAGQYSVTFTAYNADHPEGVSVTRLVEVVPLVPPVLSYGWSGSVPMMTAKVQGGLTYVLESATDLAAQNWTSVGGRVATNDTLFIAPPASTNAINFYRLRVP